METEISQGGVGRSEGISWLYHVYKFNLINLTALNQTCQQQ